jgi:hypothetical protein
MTFKLALAALALATVVSTAAQANDAPAAGGAAAPAATEKCELTKDGATATVEVAVGECAKQGGKVVAAEAPAAAPAEAK